MTDEPTTASVELGAGEEAEGDAVEPAESGTPGAAEHGHGGAEAPGWLERYVLPLWLPLAIIAVEP